MTTKTLTGVQVHSAAKMYAEEYKAGHMDRREFMSRATMLGVTSAGAYALIGGSAGRNPQRPQAMPNRAVPCAWKWKFAR